jgi:formylglycine-generating enzyme required for sulfatase activity
MRYSSDMKLLGLITTVLVALFLTAITTCAVTKKEEVAALRMAIEDLQKSFPNGYVQGNDFLDRLRSTQKPEELAALKKEALLANPLLDFERLLVIRRRIGKDANRFDGGMWGFNSKSLGIPDTGSGNTILPRNGFDNEIALVSTLRHAGDITTLYRPNDKVFVGDVDLHWDADRMLFSSLDKRGRWQIFEIGSDGKGLRQVTPGLHEDVDNYDACYLPDGGIIFGSTRTFQRVPCRSTMQTPITLMYRMNADGTGIRQLTFDQDHNWCPTVLPNGRVMYLRWEYSGIPHGASRILFNMNPDGTGQTAYYGSNSHWPNCVFFARPVPGHAGMFTGVVSGNHDVPRMGELILFDRNRSTFEADGVVQRIPGRGKKVVPIIADTISRNSWPKFLHPWPLSDKYFIAACKPNRDSLWGIYLLDVFDNMLLLHEEAGSALLEPVPLRKTKTPPVVPHMVDPKCGDAVVYLADVYKGNGLTGVPRGTVKQLRLFTYHFQYLDMRPNVRNSVGGDGPWEPLRVLGTVPVEADGSASFRVPANTPISIQPLDQNGAALQLMRSWFTAMPGESVSCIGCHEPQNEVPPVAVTIAAKRKPSEIKPWYGPTRGFSFVREVQPVLQRHCAGCHDGKSRPDEKALPDLRHVPGIVAGETYSPPYRNLYPYTRTPSLESDMHMLVPGDFHADNSEVIQMLRKGHHGVRLSAEAWDRLITWIDLCVPFYGTWNELAGLDSVRKSSARRLEMQKLYAGISDDPEAVPEQPPMPEPVIPEKENVIANHPALDGWPFDSNEARRRQSASLQIEREVILTEGIKMTLMYIPSGKFIMGDAEGCSDERPLVKVDIEKPFWMGKFEVTNQQLAQFDPLHDSRWIKGPGQQYSDAQRGWRVNGANQPVVRISWQKAMAFCSWLSAKTGEEFALPTEAQWEYACRAGTDTRLWYGEPQADFSKLASVADGTLNKARSALRKKSLIRTTPALMTIFRPAFSDKGNDGAIVSADVGRYMPNAWGLHDMHGNAAEWTLSTYREYPYRADDGRNDPLTSGNKVVRGGSFHDRPTTCRSAYRLSYPPWRRVFNVGFRVICPID